MALPLTQDCLNNTCCGNDTDDNEFVVVLHVVRAVPIEEQYVLVLMC